MAKKPVAEKFHYDEKAVSCPICGHDEFWKRVTAMNTRRMLFWELGWLNKNADNYVCDRCGYVMWFYLYDH
jgi:predicted nucleic-acid-binding Zn-ribbon protein